ncbi:hypothetical protein ACWDA9_35565 [Streptomyces sp. NPDC001193]
MTEQNPELIAGRYQLSNASAKAAWAGCGVASTSTSSDVRSSS